VRDLGLARVGGEDAGEVTGQADRRLAVPGGAVPRGIARGRDLREQVEQRVRITGPERRVAGRNAGKMIRETHGLAGAAAGAGGGTGGGVVRCGG